jgi:hypothetical protein
MAKAGYAAVPGTTANSAAVALAAATAKTVLAIVGNAAFGIDVTGFELGFDGVTAGAVPVLIEICSSTQATAGTTTAGQAAQMYGRTIASGVTVNYNYTAEPTVLTVVKSFLLTPIGGSIIRDFPFGQTIDFAPSNAVCLRLTAPAAVNVRPELHFERL